MLFKVHHARNHTTQTSHSHNRLALEFSMGSPDVCTRQLQLLCFTNPEWTSKVLELSYQPVASLDLPRNIAPGEDAFSHSLEKAFALTNNIDEEWATKARSSEEYLYLVPFVFAADKARSTSVGDLVEVEERLYIVAPSGFELLAVLMTSGWVPVHHAGVSK